MNDPDRRDRLSAALRQLETHGAPAGFTEGVLARLDARDRQRRRRQRARVALGVGTATIAAALGAALVLWPPAAPSDATARAVRADEIRRQHRLLQEELDRLQRVRDRDGNVLYLGVDTNYDLVIDLNPLLDRRVGAQAVPALEDLQVRPAQAREAERRQP